MAPTPQEDSSVGQEPRSPVNNEEKVVISGMAGLYPNCLNVKKLSEVLYNKENPITTEGVRYQFNHPEVTQYGGKVPKVNRFDAQFFKVHLRLGNSMDPMSRKVLEQTFHAIYDAGISPEQLSGKKVAVFIGSCFSETEKAFFYDAKARTGFGIAGCSRTMFANRISYWLNANGPSMSVDEACCSSTAALEQGYLAIKYGGCEAAIVGGTSLCLHPQSSVHCSRIMKLCRDGKTKSFDQNAEGCAKSEAINVLFLQKEKNALRVYAEVIHAKTEYIGLLKDQTGPRYGFYRDPEAVKSFLKAFYAEAKVPPQAIEYVEAFGSAVPEVDKMELDVIDELLCKDRDQPLLVGSVMSNIGYSEATSGISAVTKVLLGYHHGRLAANLHYSEPLNDVAALREGRIRIVTEHQRFNRSYAAVNGMSITGINTHVLLHGYYKPKDPTRYKSSIPRLVTVSGRMSTSVQYVLENLRSRPIDPEELALLHNIHQRNILGHLGRGFTILETDESGKTVSLCERAEQVDVAKRPLWFVYSGMGSQWAGMGAQLMRIPIFAAAIERCRRALEPKGIDIVNIITTTDKTIFDNILHSFVGIAAVQIGLTDILQELGMIPDGIIGHSVGELGCAYGDGCLTAEEMILSAYSRGLVSLETPFIRGSMAAIGLGYEQIIKLCPPEIIVACHNGPESSTISGPADAMKQFVTELTKKNVFAKEVPCSNIAYHSRYIADAGPGLLKYLKEVIKTPRARSARWVSTSVPQDRWGEEFAQYSSAEYHTNNLLNPVLFEETSRLIPDNAVLVEIAPHSLLQAILTRSLPSSCKNIPLTRRGHPDNTHMVLEAVGKLFMEGYNPKVQALYPKVEMPVSTGTPLLSHFVDWVHEELWPISIYSSVHRKITACCTHIISLYDKEHEYLRGHVIRGQNLYPFSAALVAVWDTLAMTVDAKKKNMPVIFRDVHLYSQPPIHNQRQIHLKVMLHRGNGNFEVLDGNFKVASGTINKFTKDAINLNDQIPEISNDKELKLTAQDIYTLLKDREYSYSDEFRSIVSADLLLTQADLLWSGNWVTLLDGMLQLEALRQSHESISSPSYIRKLCINVTKHIENKVNMPDANDQVIMKAQVMEKYNLMRCGGIDIYDIQFNNLPPATKNKYALDTLRFIPYYKFNTNIVTSLAVNLQMVAENTGKTILKVVGLVNDALDRWIFDEIQKNTDNIMGISIKYEEIKYNSVILSKKCLEEVDLVLVQNLSNNDKLLQLLDSIVQHDTFVLSEETASNSLQNGINYRVVSTHKVDRDRQLELVRWKMNINKQSSTIVVHIKSSSDTEHLQVTRSQLRSGQKLLIITSYPPLPGIKEQVALWRKDSTRNEIYLLVDKNGGTKINKSSIDQFNLDLVFNVLENGILGGDYYVPNQTYITAGKTVILQCTDIGNFNSLSWEEAPESRNDSIMVKVHYAGLNIGDVKKASGALTFKNNIENNFGMDFSGTTNSGERVMGVVSGGACSMRVRAVPELMWPVPAHWSLEDAATVPFAYAHAFYLLGIKYKLWPGLRILIHGGAGALGQAAISIALANDCCVFTTVSDIRKKHFLKKLFPKLKDDHIGNSRDKSFADLVLSKTEGNGCEFIISTVDASLKGDSLRCAAFGGGICDVTQLHNKEEYDFGMNCLNKERNYTLVDFQSIFANGSYETMKKLQVMVSEGIARGFVQPLSRVTYVPQDVQRAFRLLAKSRHQGRVLLNMTNFEPPTLPRLNCSSKNCYLIVCDETTLGLQLADFLVSCGAKKLFLHAKTQSTSYLLMKISSWERLGVQVLVSSQHIDTMKDAITIITNAQQSVPLEGIFIIGNTGKNMEEALTSLDLASRELCRNIRYFLVLNTDGSLGKYICLSRINNDLPATSLTLYDYKENGSSRWVLGAIESALNSTPSVMIAQPITTSDPLILQQISAISGINITNDLKNVTLEELGIEEDQLKLISINLQIRYNISLNINHLRSLTIHEISQLEMKGFTFEDTKGLENFFTYINYDELMSTTELMLMPTLTSGGSMRDDEFDQGETYFCIIPGMEGHHERFRVLCERLKLPALVLQPGLDNLHETPRELAQRYCEILLCKVNVKNDFYLVGYESGVVVALETARILEEQGITGTVFCIGFLPDELQLELNKHLAEFNTREQLENAVVKHMFKFMGGNNMANLENALQGAVTWPQKLDITVRSLLGHIQHSAQYVRTIMEAALVRIDQIRHYRISPQPIRSKLVLLRAASAQAPELAEMQRYSQQPVILHQLQTPLAHVAYDHQCAAIINHNLNPQIKEKFEEKNICEQYLLNSNAFSRISTGTSDE